MRHLTMFLFLLAACGSPKAEKGANNEQCTNGVDDNGDGLADCADPQCASESCDEICDDGLDNDLDERIDCEDPACDGSLCPEECTDGRDNDGDNQIDCQDVDCTLTCDADGDGYVSAAFGGDDCDDANPVIHPAGTEICDGIDNNCDGLVDRDDPELDRDSMELFYADVDGDGYGDPGDSTQDCEATTGYVDNSDDCGDNDPYRNPLASEVCNGFDDNCDGLADDNDPLVDLTGATTFYPDLDGDLDGDPLGGVPSCERPQGFTPLGTDCDDTDPAVHGRDLDGDTASVCDGDCDDSDPNLENLDIDNDGFSTCDGDCDDGNFGMGPQLDVDGDGSHVCEDCDDGDPLVDVLDVDGDGWTTCDGDCDDLDPLLELNDYDFDGVTTCDGDCDDLDLRVVGPTMWVPDADGDGYGAGAPIGPVDCDPPIPGYVPDNLPVDCDDIDPTIHPTAPETCQDGVDSNCNGDDGFCGACADILAGDPFAPDGIHNIEPVGLGPTYDVYCDMTTDGGGWTLVASSNDSFSDAAIGYHNDLTRLTPGAAHDGIWDGLRPMYQGAPTDIRFACSTNPGGAMTVDMSFYQTIWYDEITTGTDADSCFNESNGSGDDPPPERRNNVNNDWLPAGDPWGAGYLEGEDSCGDTSDFTIDFDDRGMDSNQSDGTDWGQDDGSDKCGNSGVSGVWFIFVR